MPSSGRPSRARKRARKKGSSGTGRRIAVVAMLLAGALVVGVAGFAVWLWPRCSGPECPDVQALRSYTPPQATRVFDGEGRLITHLAPERRIVIPLERIPAHVTGAFLAVEDRRFFDHDGVDYRRVAGAAIRDIQTMSFEEGFSTITMQLARNVFPEHLTRAKTLRRKAWEVLLAREMEDEFSKGEILELYLNQIYLGDGYYGVEAASQGYFGKSTAELGVDEAAVLAALPKAPSTYNPRSHPEAALERRDLVLRLMANAQVVSEAEASEAIATPLELAPPIEASADAPYYVASVRRELGELFGEGAETAGFRVYTGLDRQLQRAAVTALKEQLASIEGGEFGRFRGPNCSAEKPADAASCLQGMFVAIDNRTGDVLALVGGRDFALSQFDRVTQAHRQAGSAFKPFLFASALASGIPITTTLLGPGAAEYEGEYRPADHVGSDTPVNLRDALRLSSNQAAVVLGEQVGVSRVVQTARSMGITTPMQEYPSTLLGAAEVVPLEMVGAFTAFANGGRLVTPRLIQRIEDSDGNTVWEAPVRSQLVLSSEVAFLTTDMMRDVVDHGTGWRARAGGLPGNVPAAGKTGTTNDVADAWFVGFTPDVSAGVWVGYDRPHEVVAGGGGGTLAAPVWGEVMASYYQSHAAPAAWSAPAGVVSVAVDRETGQLATSSCPEDHIVNEWFMTGTEPTDYCRLHPEPGVQQMVRDGVRAITDFLGF